MSDSAIPWSVAHQAPLSMEFSRQEYQSGFPFPSPGDLPNPGTEPRFPAFQADSLPSEPPGKPKGYLNTISTWRSLVGCHLWGPHRVGHDWSDLAAAAAAAAHELPQCSSHAISLSQGKKKVPLPHSSSICVRLHLFPVSLVLMSIQTKSHIQMLMEVHQVT